MAVTISGTGVITGASISAASISNTPAGNIAATTVQAAINEVDTEKEVADVNIVKSNATKTLTAGYSATSYNGSTVSSGTYTPSAANGNLQYYTNNGAHTLAPPTTDTSIAVLITNGASAGAITTSGFTKVSGTFATTNTYKYMCSIVRINSISLLTITALQ